MKYFTKQEALEAVKNTLENANILYYDEVIDTFKKGYNCIPELALNDYGLDNALIKIQSTNGIKKDFANAQSLVNTLWLAIGKNVTDYLSLNVEYSYEVTEVENAKILEEVNNLIDFLNKGGEL